jgi:hypothetical protein
VVELVVRFLVGGAIVSLFALIADVLKPKGFAALFGAAPSVALATLALTIATHGRLYAATEARSMVAGAAAFLLYRRHACTSSGGNRPKQPRQR